MLDGTFFLHPSDLFARGRATRGSLARLASEARGFDRLADDGVAPSQPSWLPRPPVHTDQRGAQTDEMLARRPLAPVCRCVVTFVASVTALCRGNDGELGPLELELPVAHESLIDVAYESLAAVEMETREGVPGLVGLVANDPRVGVPGLLDHVADDPRVGVPGLLDPVAVEPRLGVPDLLSETAPLNSLPQPCTLLVDERAADDMRRRLRSSESFLSLDPRATRLAVMRPMPTPLRSRKPPMPTMAPRAAADPVVRPPMSS